MNPFWTYLFLAGSLVVLFPVSWLAWDVYKARGLAGSDTSTLAWTIFYIAGASFIFHASQFSTVLLGFLGAGPSQRTLITVLIDGSLILLAIAFYYALYTIKKMRRKI